MKIALCLFGNVGHLEMQGVRKKKKGYDPYNEAFLPKNKWSQPSPAKKGFDLALEDYEVDTFIHSWSTEFKDDLEELYKPRRSEIVEQQKFGSDVEDYGLVGKNMDSWEVSEWALEGYKLLLPSRGSVQKIIDEMQDLTFRTESRWWSSKRCIELKSEYEREHGITYDFVVISRIDNIFRCKLPLAKLNPAKFYGGERTGRADIAYALFDYWFISNSSNMDAFATLYDRRYDYCIRPTFACREHVRRLLGVGSVQFLLHHNRDYRLVRDM